MVYPEIVKALRTCFNVENGLSIDVATRLYVRMAQTDGRVEILKKELRQAFSDSELSWRRLLCNEEYEVYDALSEDEAIEYAKKILLYPIDSLS